MRPDETDTRPSRMDGIHDYGGIRIRHVRQPPRLPSAHIKGAPMPAPSAIGILRCASPYA
ncbi:MAG: hypothetical protein ACLRWP_10285 [Bilophila wadsworthia]